MSSKPVIALVGAPNCGKTALFNALTGARQKVANYPGVTVERIRGELTLPCGRDVDIVDLPGTYSLRGRSPDEMVTRDVVLGRLEGEDLTDYILCVANATNLRMALRLILELKAVGRPMIVALNMADLANKQGAGINMTRLSRELGVPVVSSVAVRKGGTDELRQTLDRLVVKQCEPVNLTWQEPDSDQIRAMHREAERILKDCSFRAGHEELTRRVDTVLLHPMWGVAILMAVLFLMFQAVFSWAEPAMNAIEALVKITGVSVQANMGEGLLRSLLVDGVIAGVGSVVIFLPQILILFFFIIILEDSGYMARAAFLMDRLMAGAGLHGRAFIPLLSSFACAIPGIMSARVIESKTDRLTTILIAPLMTCSARLPVYALIIAAFIPNKSLWGGIGLQGLVMFALYVAGIVFALLVGFVLKRLIWKQEAEPFLLELPSYKRPSLRNLFFGLRQRATVFLTRAGSIIMALMVIIWFLCTFPAAPEGATGPAIDHSFAGIIGHALEPFLRPIGFNWQISLALIPGMAAREVAVGVLATIYSLSEGADEALQTALASTWTLPTALSFLVWYVFAPQCLSTLAVVRRETNSWRWPLIQFSYMFALAYGASFVTYRLALAAGL